MMLSEVRLISSAVEEVDNRFEKVENGVEKLKRKVAEVNQAQADQRARSTGGAVPSHSDAERRSKKLRFGRREMRGTWSSHPMMGSLWEKRRSCVAPRLKDCSSASISISMTTC